MDKEKNKKRLKAILEEMYSSAIDNDQKRVIKFNSSTFVHLYEETFGRNSPLTEESMPYDRARNNILMYFTKGISEEQRIGFLEDARKYLEMI